VIGGLLALAGSFAVELRRERRRQIGAARLVLSELIRSGFEIKELLDLNPKETRFDGPLPKISAKAWAANAAEFVGRLDAEDLESVDSTMFILQSDAEFGISAADAKVREGEVDQALKILRPLSKLTWFDRHVWRL
jgi:hypothetical protein